MLLPNEADLAWQVAGELSPHLTRSEKSVVYLTLGCDENFKAIADMLELARQSSIPLSDNALGSIARLLDGYADSPEEPFIRKLLYQVHAQTRWMPISPLPTPALHEPKPHAWSVG